MSQKRRNQLAEEKGKFVQNNMKMNRLGISDKIRALRKTKGLSQETLAENAGINLRTLQRIEAGNAEPRGETLRLLAQALDVSVEELAVLVPESPAALREDPGFLKLMNLSTLCFWFIPFGNIFVPLAFWVFRRNQVVGVNELGKRILNFQIIWTLICYGCVGVVMYLTLNSAFFMGPFTMMWFFLLLYIVNTIYIVITHIRLGRGEEKMYVSLKTSQ